MCKTQRRNDRVQQENGCWQLTAAGPRWSYAASWAVSTEKELESTFLIEIELRVSGGTIGIGCVARDCSTFKGKEVLVEPAQTLQTATVLVDDVSDLGHLIIRNADIAGSTAHIEVVAINAFTAEPAAPKQQSAILSLQKKRLPIPECDVILRGGEAVLSPGSVQEPGIDIVPIEKIHAINRGATGHPPKLSGSGDDLGAQKRRICRDFRSDRPRFSRPPHPY